VHGFGGSCAVLFRTVHELLGVPRRRVLGGRGHGFILRLVSALFSRTVPDPGSRDRAGVCYNSGRVLAAVGALTQGQLVGFFGGSYAKAGAIVYAGLCDRHGDNLAGARNQRPDTP